jgi:heme/copper-type cytochrome/quinol oxidase subunit 2
MLKPLVSMMWVKMPAIVAVVAGTFVMFVARLMANRQHVKRLQSSGAVSRIADVTTGLLLTIASLCRNTILYSAISSY